MFQVSEDLFALILFPRLDGLGHRGAAAFTHVPSDSSGTVLKKYLTTSWLLSLTYCTNVFAGLQCRTFWCSQCKRTAGLRLWSCRANTLTYPPCEFAPGAFQLRKHRRLRVAAAAAAAQLARNLLKRAFVVPVKNLFEVSFVVKHFHFLAALDPLMKDAIVE